VGVGGLSAEMMVSCCYTCRCVYLMSRLVQQRGKISVFGLTLDKALYIPWWRSGLCPHTYCTHPLQYKAIHDFLSVLPNLGKNRKSIIYTRCRSNLDLTTSGTFCSGGTKRHSSSPSRTLTQNLMAH